MSGAARLRGLLSIVLPRPGLYASALRAVWSVRQRDWFRRPPFLPLPPRAYLEWRLHTAYGADERGPTADELKRYLRWTEQMQRSERATSDE
ncbi:MAG: hypothetical protein ACRELD_06970 [Longimicrobiales bacterium]